RRSPGRGARASALRGLADLLRLRRRQGEAEQEDRHEALDAALRPPARRDREPRSAHRAAAANAAPPPDVEAAVRPADRPCDGSARALRRRPRRARGLRSWPRAVDAALLLRAEGGRG